MYLKYIILLLFVTFISFANSKIAIISNGTNSQNISYLFVAKYYKNFDFVERQEINKINNELSLKGDFYLEKFSRQTKLLGANIFISINDLPKDKFEIIIFETDCGFRLKYLICSQNIEIEKIKKLLEEAIEKNKQPKNLRFISIAGVRNNVGKNLAKETKYIETQILTKINTLNIVVLEREYLLDLIVEQELNKRWKDIATASDIIHLEFNIGRTKKEFITTIYFIAPDDKVIFKQSFLNTEKNGLNKLLLELEEFIIKPRKTEKYSAKNEAKRFVREAQVGSERFKKLFVALMLDFYDVLYDFSNLNANAIHHDQLSEKKVTEYYLSVIAKAIKEKLYDDENNANRLDNIFICINNFIRRKKISKDLQIRYKSILKEYRKLYYLQGKGDFSNYQTLKFNRIKKEYYTTTTEWKKEKLLTWYEVLNYCENLPPEEQKYYNLKDFLNFGNLTIMELFEYLNDIEIEHLINDFAQRINRYNEPFFDIMLKVLKINAINSRTQVDETLLHQNISELVNSENYKSYKTKIFDNILDYSLGNIFKDYENSSKIADNNNVENNIEKYQNFIKQKKTQKFIAENNPTWDMKQIWYKNENTKYIMGSTIDPNTNEIYFIAVDDFDKIIFKINSDLTFDRVATYPNTASNSPTYIPLMPSKIIVNDVYIAFFERNYSDKNAVFIGKKGKILKKLRNVPYKIKDIAINNGRFYLLSESALISCDANGEDRIIHFDVANESKKALGTKLNLNNQFKFIFFNPKLKNKILAVTGNTSLWEIDLKTRKFIHKKAIGSFLIDNNNSSLYGEKFFFCDFYGFNEYNITSGKSKLLASKQKKENGVCKLNKNLNYGGNFFNINETLLISGENNIHNINKNAYANIIDLKNYDTSPMFLYPVAIGIFPFPNEKKVIAIDFEKIVLLQKK